MDTRTLLSVLALGLLTACASTISDKKVFATLPPKAVDAPVEVWIDGDAPAEVRTAAGVDYRNGAGPDDMVKVASFNLRKGSRHSWNTVFDDGRTAHRISSEC